MDVILLSFTSCCCSLHYRQVPLYHCLPHPIHGSVRAAERSGGRCGFLFSLLFRARFSHVCFNGYRTASTPHLSEGAVRRGDLLLKIKSRLRRDTVQDCGRQSCSRRTICGSRRKTGVRSSYYPEYIKRGYAQPAFCCVLCVLCILFLS